MNSIQQLVENVMYQMTEIASRNRADGIKGMAREIQASDKRSFTGSTPKIVVIEV